MATSSSTRSYLHRNHDGRQRKARGVACERMKRCEETVGWGQRQGRGAAAHSVISGSAMTPTVAAAWSPIDRAIARPRRLCQTRAGEPFAPACKAATPGIWRNTIRGETGRAGGNELSRGEGGKWGRGRNECSPVSRGRPSEECASSLPGNPACDQWSGQWT